MSTLFIIKRIWMNECLEKLELGYRPPQLPPEKKQFLHGVWVLVRGYLHVRYDILSSINFKDINGYPKLGPRTLIKGHFRRPRVALLDSTGMIYYLSVIVPEAYLAPFPRYSLRQCPTSLYLATPFAFNPRWRGSPGTISVNRQTELRRQIPERNVVTFGYLPSQFSFPAGLISRTHGPFNVLFCSTAEFVCMVC